MYDRAQLLRVRQPSDAIGYACVAVYDSSAQGSKYTRKSLLKNIQCSAIVNGSVKLVSYGLFLIYECLLISGS